MKVRARYISLYTLALVLILPSLVWIIFDKGVWVGDPVSYAFGSVVLYQKLITDFSGWKGLLIYFSSEKAPLIYWIGQFFVPLGRLIGSIDFSLLLVPLIAGYITLILSFRSFELLFKNRLIAFCGCVVIASSPLFNGLSTQFWVEPIQLAIVSWFIYIMIKADSWNFYFTLAQYITAIALAMLIKTSTPLYIAGPAIAFWVIVLNCKMSMSIDKKKIFLLLNASLIFLAAAYFYFVNFRSLTSFAHHAATSPLFGSPDPSGLQRISLWIDHLSNGIFLLWTFRLVVIILLLGVLKTAVLAAYKSLTGIFAIAIFHIVIFLLAWTLSNNNDPRYFLPVLPYFTILICWGLSAIDKKLLTKIVTGIFLIQFILVNGFAFGMIKLEPSYGLIRPLIRDSSYEMNILHDGIQLTKQGSYKSIFDTDPLLECTKIGYEFAKQNLLSKWWSRYLSLDTFFDRQEIDKGQINIEMVWEKILEYNPDLYFALNTKFYSTLPNEDMQQPYLSDYELARKIILTKIGNCGLYEPVDFPLHPEIVVFKRCVQQ